MSARDEILAANERFAAGFDAGDLSGRPERGFAVVTCMDVRLDPVQAFGLRLGDANVIRNAGAVVTDDVLRSLVFSHWFLGSEEAFVIGHTECGVSKVTDMDVRVRLAEAGVNAWGVEFATFTDVAVSVREGIRRIQKSELLPRSFRATGFVYDVKTGRLREVS